MDLQTEKGIVMKRGIVYAVGCEPVYYKQARDSVRSLKEQMPGIEATVFTDDPLGNWPDFDKVEKLELESLDWMIAKIYALRWVPYDIAIYLDGDTYICHNLSDLFKLVEGRFDMAMTFSSGKPSRFPTEDVPKDFPDYSAGIIAMKRSRAALNFLDLWEKIFYRHKEQYAHLRKNTDRHPAQPSFRLALYHSDDLHYVALPRREYNCTFWSGYVHQKVKIIHARHKVKKLQAFAAALNENPNSPRLYWHREVIRTGKSYSGYKE